MNLVFFSFRVSPFQNANCNSTLESILRRFELKDRRFTRLMKKITNFSLPKFFIIWTKWARCWKIKKKIEKEKSYDTNFAMVHHGVLGWFGFFLSSGGLVRRPDRGWVCGRSLKHSHELWITVLMQTNSIERFSSELI